MTGLTEQNLDRLLRDRAVRLLVLGSGKRIWEASSSPLHQMIIDDIRAALPSAPTTKPKTAQRCPRFIWQIWQMILPMSCPLIRISARRPTFGARAPSIIPCW
jgi:hypothetical protein